MGETEHAEAANWTKGAGLVASLLWVVIIGFNILLLSQVLETWFPAQQDAVRWAPPYIGRYVGSYDIFSTIMAVLVGLVQAALGIIYFELSRRSHRLSAMLFICDLVAVMAEMGAAVYRAWLVAGGEVVTTSGFFDTMMGRGGLIFTGFMGLIVPVGAIALGIVGFEFFLKPVPFRWLNVSIDLFESLPARAVGALSGLWEKGAGPDKTNTPPVDKNAAKTIKVYVGSLKKKFGSLSKEVRGLSARVAKLKGDAEIFSDAGAAELSTIEQHYKSMKVKTQSKDTIGRDLRALGQDIKRVRLLRFCEDSAQLAAIRASCETRVRQEREILAELRERHSGLTAELGEFLNASLSTLPEYVREAMEKLDGPTRREFIEKAGKLAAGGLLSRLAENESAIDGVERSLGVVARSENDRITLGEALVLLRHDLILAKRTLA